ncbi:MAG: peptidylprolyl isomerase [Actinomycetota bacterium]
MSTREEALKHRRRVRGATVAIAGVVVIALAVCGDSDDGGPSGSEPSDTESDAAACGAERPSDASPQQYNAPPDFTLDESADYRAVVHTSCGDIAMDLLEDKAPVTVNNFVFLAREGFFDGLIWHRVEPNSVLQTGDPNGQNGTEPDGPGYAIEEEPPKSKDAYVYGVVGMANAGPGTTGSQWFIVVHDNEEAGFPPDYSIFGIVDEESYATLEAVERQPTRGGNIAVEAVKPITPIYIESIEITES